MWGSAAADEPVAPVDDSDEVADWFETKTDPSVARAVAAAEAVAHKPIDTSPLHEQLPPSAPTASFPAQQFPIADEVPDSDR